MVMVNQEFTIKDIQKVLKCTNGKITNINISRLTAPGENYLSLVFKVDFEVSIDNGLSKTISTVAKRIPKPANQDGLRITSLAMKNEIRWYLEMVPLFKQIANEFGIMCDYFPICLGSRFSLDPLKTFPDEEAILLLENLIVKGFKNEDRYVGFNLTSSKAFLKTIASFHAITLAAKFKNPKMFHKIKQFMDSLPNPEPPALGCFNPERLVMDLMLQIPA
ncbi:unnamed protein product [Ceutorhynchus assimilis]|uniref:Uncharacterized protein n=1 Tax=Ceutorhynchus assimilis TaxID=467358 RepID=A0A9P0DGM3_9CUCU|nr:unnamed protein product [Ceutorhynchus assimilis]